MQHETIAPDEFKSWGKIARPNRNIISITEKMDGTNSCISIYGGEIHAVQSRKRLITPNADGQQTDNFGFAQWVEENTDMLLRLGDGRHYGEWCGPGIQQNPHNLEEKQLFLFNVGRFKDGLPEGVPAKLVRQMYFGAYSEDAINDSMQLLLDEAAGTAMKPEGVIVHFVEFDGRIKYTFENQDGKWSNG